jgi:transposase
MAKGDEIPKTNPAEIEKLIEQIRGTNLEPGVKDKIERLLRTVLLLVEVLQRKNTSIKKLRELIFGKRTERYQKRKSELAEKAGESGKADEADDQRPKAEDRAGEREKKKGHGHRSAEDYSGARVVKCFHGHLKVGDACPASLCGGRLYDLKEPTSLLQFTGQPLIQVTNYERQVLRCAKCQGRYEAPLPEGVAKERYDATCDATIALMRYGAGLPWYRQAGLQAMGGLPLLGL